MDLCKIKPILFLLVIGLMLGFVPVSNTPAFADSESSNPNIPAVDQTQQATQNLSNQTKADLPAVNIDNLNSKDKNFIPVTELKGSVGENETSPETPFNSWINGHFATGEWFGIRPKLEEKGIDFDINYFNGDFLNMGGGLKSASNIHDLGLIDAAIKLDTQKMGLWDGGKFVFRFQEKHGLGLTPSYIGDYQGVETDDAPRFNQFSEYYYEHHTFDDHFKIKVGRQDAGVDFCNLASALNFGNTSFWYMPTIPLPSYPYTNIGASVTVKPFVDWLSLKSGIYDGNRRINQWGFNTGFNERGSLFNIEELGVTPNIKDHPGNYFIGYWLHTGSTPALSNDVINYAQSYGLYLGGEQMILKKNKDPKDKQGLIIFDQFGYAPPDRSIVSRYYGAGAEYKGPLPHRDKDIIGFATAIADFSGRLKNMDGYGNYGCETALESFYKVQFTPWLAIQPDFQVIFHPSGLYKNAFEIGLRSMLTL